MRQGVWIKVWAYLGWDQYGYKSMWVCDRCHKTEFSPSDHVQQVCDREYDLYRRTL